MISERRLLLSDCRTTELPGAALRRGVFFLTPRTLCDAAFSASVILLSKTDLGHGRGEPKPPDKRLSNALFQALEEAGMEGKCMVSFYCLIEVDHVYCFKSWAHLLT